MHTLTRTRTHAHARMRARAHTHTTRTRTQVNSRTRTQPSRTPEIGEQGLSQQLLNVVPVLIRNVILLGPQHVVLCFVLLVYLEGFLAPWPFQPVTCHRSSKLDH